MISTVLDLTTKFNADAKVQIDTAGWDYVVAQFVSPTGTVTFKATNDGGAITGVSEDNPQTATNWIAVQGANLNSGSAVSTIAISGLVKFNIVGRYIQFESVGQTVGKLLIFYTQIF